MGAKVDIPSIGRRQYMRWNGQIGVGNLYTELFVTDILIHSSRFVWGNCEIRNPNCKVLPWSFKFHLDKDRSHVQWEHSDSFKW